MNIVDRRLNPGGKSHSNRQRFLRRAKSLVQRAVREGSGERGITDLERSGEVSIPADGVSEPRLRRSSSGGLQDHILPGNKRFVEGDSIERPTGGSGGGSSAGDGEEGQDEFRFVLTREEFLDLFLDDLELPDLAKQRLASLEAQGFRRAGYTTSGSPVNLALLRTMRNALSRRIAMRRPTAQDLSSLEREIDALARDGRLEDELAAAREELARLEVRSRRIPYIDPLDLRYRRLVPVSKPIAQAVMFCLMDVSGSMTEHMKDLAKRFYMLLYVFLTRRYQHVDVVFIRHTHLATEVDEETFFHSPATGGTIVSSALNEMRKIVAERYPLDDWNIYAAQASDGDNAPDDNTVCADLLQTAILPLCQYFAYLEVGPEGGGFHPGLIERKSTLWQTYEPFGKEGAVAMRRVSDRREIYHVFRELFRRNPASREAATP
jgi:uncharacterized sporulation protein YeaH/YhbH (DUF444 family)